MMNDTYRHKGMRKALVEEIKSKGITSIVVLSAIENVPRHLFLENAFLNQAYEDKPFPIGEGQTISQPFTVAYQTELLGVKKNDKILEIGTGSGYQASVLAEIGAKVFTIERHKNLFEKTKKKLKDLGYHQIKCFFGDGYKGLVSFAPFDKILITAAAPSIPEELTQQLKVGGIMVIPLGEKIQNMIKLTKISESEIKQENFGDFKFVPMLKGRVY